MMKEYVDFLNVVYIINGCNYSYVQIKNKINNTWYALFKKVSFYYILLIIT